MATAESSLYHLSRRWFYRAIGAPDCRNRRQRAPGSIHTRLLTLDFVLARPDRSYLLPDRDKTRYLVGERSLPRYNFPAAKGRWIDRFPLYTAEFTPTQSQVIVFKGF